MKLQRRKKNYFFFIPGCSHFLLVYGITKLLYTDINRLLVYLYYTLHLFENLFCSRYFIFGPSPNSGSLLTDMDGFCVIVCFYINFTCYNLYTPEIYYVSVHFFSSDYHDPKQFWC